MRSCTDVLQRSNPFVKFCPLRELYTEDIYRTIHQDTIHTRAEALPRESAEPGAGQGVLYSWGAHTDTPDSLALSQAKSPHVHACPSTPCATPWRRRLRSPAGARICVPAPQKRMGGCARCDLGARGADLVASVATWLREMRSRRHVAAPSSYCPRRRLTALATAAAAAATVLAAAVALLAAAAATAGTNWPRSSVVPGAQ